VKFSRYSIIGIMVALLLSAVAIMPVFGAVTGTVAVDKTFVAPGGSAVITVTDADVNVLIPSSDVRTGTWGSVGTTVFLSLDDSLGGTGAFFAVTASGDEIAGTPVIKTRSTAGATSDYSAGVFNRTTGRISVQFAGETAPGADTLTINYNLAAKNTVNATVTSPSDATGISVLLMETAADTGIFTGTLNVTPATGLGSTASNDGTDTILAVAGQGITIKYVDGDPAGNRTTSLTVESTKPAGSLVGPANKSVTTSLTPKLDVDFTDNDSLVDAGEIGFTISSAKTNTGVDLGPSGTNVVTKTTVTTAAITNGHNGETTLGGIPDGLTIEIKWYASGKDKAGNLGRTDADPATTGDQDYTLYIDKSGPTFVGTLNGFAGAWYDSAGATVVTDTGKSINTSIGIHLPKVLDALSVSKTETLSAASVTPADFDVDSLKQSSGVSVDNVTPTAVNVFAGAPDWIFLTVPAMAPDAKPVVNLKDTAGGISDTAGNATTAGQNSTQDAQAPVVTWSLNRNLHKTDGTVTITTNEAGPIPVVTVINQSATTVALAVGQTVTLVGTNIYESKITGAFGVNSIQLSVDDANGNTTTKGGGAPDVDFPKSDDIALYIDNLLPAATVHANNTDIVPGSVSVESSVPFFLTAGFAAEKNEFGLNGGLVLVGTAPTTDLDPQNAVTLATATLDGVSILGQQDTQDNVTFNFAINDIATGEHELVIIANDAAGNEKSTGTIKFTVTARKAYSVAMSAGWNLVSFPGNPADGAIDSVLPSSHPATDVLSFDDGVWAVASRSAGGSWEGTLLTMDGNHGYWINTSSSKPIQALLALTSVGSAATLPTISIESGWNLVSVIDLAHIKQGTADGPDADSLPDDTETGANYFTSVTWSVAYTYDSSTRAWSRVTGSTGNVKNGQGVWVWATKAGTLIP
jgi:hypothetical protein